MINSASSSLLRGPITSIFAKSKSFTIFISIAYPKMASSLRNSSPTSNLVILLYNLGETQKNSVVSIYTKFDSLILERIVGSAKGSEMVREYCNNVSFII